MRIELIQNQPKYQISNKSTQEKSDFPHTEKNKNITNETKQQGHIGLAVTTIAIALVGTAFMLSKGFNKNTGKLLNKIKNYLEKKRDLSTIKESNKWTKFYEYNIRKINTFIKKAESINNITSLKDILFMKLMYKTEFTKKIHTGITEYFEKLSKKSVLDSYKKTEKSFHKMNKIFDKLDEKILKESPDETFEYKGKTWTKRKLIEEAKWHREIATTFALNYISAPTLKNRYDYINKPTSALYKKFWDASFKDFWTKDNKFKKKEMWQTFIAAEQIKDDKKKFIDISNTARQVLSYSKNDKINMMGDYLSKIDEILPADDEKGIEIVKKLQWFIKNPDGLKNNKELFINELGKLKKHHIITPDENLSKNQEACKQTYLNVVESLMDDSGRGEIQDMMNIYYKIAPFEFDDSGALLSVKNAVNSFNKSMDKEINDFVDKLRDLRLGSAPTDILTIVFSFLTLSFGLGYAKDKDKRKSIMLRSGIPVLGAIATTTIATTKLISGGKSLALGFLSGIILNQIGKIADKKRPHSQKVDTDQVQSD